MLDLAIRGGLVFDGRGSKPDRLDIGVESGRLRFLPAGALKPARRTIDATDLWLAPGFIDIHTHYDLEVELAPALDESLRHGVTSVVMGNCSLSATCGDPRALAEIFERVETLPHSLIQRWQAQAGPARRPADTFRLFESLPLGPNIATLVGHSALRVAVMGLGRSLFAAPDQRELTEIIALAREALDSGALGISIDGVHWHKVAGRYAGRALPSHHASWTEIRALAELCRERDAVLQVTPDPRRPSFLARLLLLASGLGRAPLRLTVLAALDMSAHPAIWPFFGASSSLVNGPLGGNMRWQSLTEPFRILSDGPLTPLFEEFETGVCLGNCRDSSQRRRLWRDPSFRRAFAEEWRRGYPRTFHRDLRKMWIVSAPDPSLIGLSLAEIAEQRSEDPIDTFIALLEQYDSQLRWSSIGANARPEIRRKLLAHPNVLPGFSDAGAHARNLAFYDSALALLREAAQTGFMSPERAIQRVTREPARWFNIDRGELRPGGVADLLLIDPRRLMSPTPEPLEILDSRLSGAPRLVKRDSHSPLRLVLVGGAVAFENDQPAESLGELRMGTVLRSSPQNSDALQRHRNRINRVDDDHDFTDYWDIFVYKHQDPRNIAVHVLALVFLYALPLLSLGLGRWSLLILLPCSQLFGLIGHAIYEPSPIDPKDSAFSWRATCSLHRLAWLKLRGQYQSELERVRSALDRYQRRDEITAEPEK